MAAVLQRVPVQTLVEHAIEEFLSNPSVTDANGRHCIPIAPKRDDAQTALDDAQTALTDYHDWPQPVLSRPGFLIKTRPSPRQRFNVDHRQKSVRPYCSCNGEVAPIPCLRTLGPAGRVWTTFDPSASSRTVAMAGRSR